MLPDKNQIIKQLTEKLPALLADTPVALGQATTLSDVDVGLILREDAKSSPLELLHMQLRLSVALSREMGILEFDVRIVNDMPLSIRGHVACHGIPVYVADEQARIAFETRTRDDYFDFEPYASKIREAYFADLRERGFKP